MTIFSNRKKLMMAQGSFAYDVYGLGNALVDTEFEVSLETLKKLNVEKGLMALIDESTLEKLLFELEGMKHQKNGGGSAANTLVALASLGGKGFYSCKVSNDEWGKFFLKDLLLSGLDTNLKDEDLTSGDTGKCLVFVTPDADRTMNTYLGITQTFSVNQLNQSALEKSCAIYIEGYLVASPTGLEAAMTASRWAKSANALRTISFSDPNMVKFFRQNFYDIKGEGLFDLVFCNEDEAMTFTGRSDVHEALEELKKFSVGIALTRGKNGALLYDGEKTYTVKSPVVNAIDSNGAGDLFAGSFLYALSKDMPFDASGEFAVNMASTLVCQFGARLKPNQYQELKSKHLS